MKSITKNSELFLIIILPLAYIFTNFIFIYNNLFTFLECVIINFILLVYTIYAITKYDMDENSWGKFILVLPWILFVVVGCTELIKKNNNEKSVHAELKIANEQKIENEKQEKLRYEKLLSQYPDKALYDELIKKELKHGSSWNPQERLKEYSIFLDKFPQSTLAPEVRMLIDEVEQKIKIDNDARQAENDARNEIEKFKSVQSENLKDIVFFPQRYIGKTVRINGVLEYIEPTRSSKGWVKHGYSITADGESININTDTYKGRVNEKVEYVFGVPIIKIKYHKGEFLIKIDRDQQGKVTYYLQEYQ